MDVQLNSKQVQAGVHQESVLRKSTAELPPSWDNGAVVKEVRGIFTISGASEIEFSQLLIKLLNCYSNLR